MRFEWDENKRLLNLRDHEVDFIDMVQIFDGRPTLTFPSQQFALCELEAVLCGDGILPHRVVY
jgi:uncharacterized DUF497 family protein